MNPLTTRSLHLPVYCLFALGGEGERYINCCITAWKQEITTVLMFFPAGLVLTGNDEAALECFESLIHLAKDQLNHVFAEKSKLPQLSPEERKEMFSRVCSLNFDFLVKLKTYFCLLHSCKHSPVY